MEGRRQKKEEGRDAINRVCTFVASSKSLIDSWLKLKIYRQFTPIKNFIA